MELNNIYKGEVLNNEQNILPISGCDNKVYHIKKPLKKEFMIHLRRLIPDIVPVSCRPGKGYQLNNNNEISIPNSMSSFLIPGEYFGVEASSIDTRLLNYLFLVIEKNFNLKKSYLLSSRFQLNIFPLNASYNALSLIPHVDLVSKKNNYVPIALNINLNMTENIKTAFFENERIKSKFCNKKIIEENKLTGDFFKDFDSQSVLQINNTFTYSDEIKLKYWNKYQELNLDPGDISIYLGNYFHAPVLNKNQEKNNQFRISLAGFFIYADDTTGMLMQLRKSRTEIVHGSLNGYRLES